MISLFGSSLHLKVSVRAIARISKREGAERGVWSKREWKEPKGRRMSEAVGRVA